MAEIMGMFAAELDDFVADYDNQFWDASFHGEIYPPRIIMERSTPPLYRVTAPPLCWSCSCMGSCRNAKKWRRRRNDFARMYSRNA